MTVLRVHADLYGKQVFSCITVQLIVVHVVLLFVWYSLQLDNNTWIFHSFSLGLFSHVMHSDQLGKNISWIIKCQYQ